jgi:hypothetical protein
MDACDAVTNVIFSLKKVPNKFYVACNSRDGQGAFVAHKPNGIDMHFNMHADGLHCCGTDNHQVTVDQASTVKTESEGFSKKQIGQAKRARAFQAKVGCPSTSDLQLIVQSDLIVNCPMMTEDID